MIFEVLQDLRQGRGGRGRDGHVDPREAGGEDVARQSGGAAGERLQESQKFRNVDRREGSIFLSGTYDRGWGVWYGPKEYFYRCEFFR